MADTLVKSGTSKKKLQEKYTEGYTKGYSDGQGAKDLSLNKRIGEFTGDQSITLTDYISGTELATYGLTIADLTADNFYILPTKYASASGNITWSNDCSYDGYKTVAHDASITYDGTTGIITTTGMYQQSYFRDYTNGEYRNNYATGNLTYVLYLRWSQAASDYQGELNVGYIYRYGGYSSKATTGSLFTVASDGKLAFAKSITDLPITIISGGGDNDGATRTILVGSTTIATMVGTLGTTKTVSVSANAGDSITVNGDYNGAQWFTAVLRKVDYS